MQNEEGPRRSSGKRRLQWVGRAPSPPPAPLSWHLCPGMHNCVKGIEKPLKTHLKCSETCLSLHPRLTHLLAPVAGLGGEPASREGQWLDASGSQAPLAPMLGKGLDKSSPSLLSSQSLPG